MGQKDDTIKVELVTIEFSVSKKKDNVIVIEQKEKENNDKTFIESPLFASLIVPIIVILIGFFLNRLWYRRKEKRDGQKVQSEIFKLREERNKIKEETTQIKKSFQPIVLTTLMQSQEFYRGDKVNALKAIVNFRTDLFYVEQYYYEGELVEDSITDYYTHIYRSVGAQTVKNISKIINDYGYLFPDLVINKMKGIQSDITNLSDIWNRESSVQNDQMPDDAEDIMKILDDKFDQVIELIRNDLHIDNGFINEFIEEYKELNN